MDEEKTEGGQQVAKKTIPHVSEHPGDVAKQRAAANHAFDQVEAGHYTLKAEQHQMGPGHERLIIDRIEVNTDHPAEHHGLWD